MISAFDIATRLTGWAAVNGSRGPVDTAVEIGPTGDDLGKLLVKFHEYLEIHFARFEPKAVVYEAPILVVKGRHQSGRTDKLLTVRKLYAMGAHLEFFCAMRGVPCHEVSLQEVKNEVTGNNYAKKDAMVAVARKVGLDLPKGPGIEDAADAWGAWLLGLRHYSPEISRRWDKLIWGPKGALL